MKLQGKTAVVTGAGGYIGRRIAELFALEGAAIVIVDKNEKSGRRVAEEIAGNGGKAISVAADISDPESVSRFVEAGCSAFGGIDILVNNAAMTGKETTAKPFLEIDLAREWRKAIDTNLTGTFICSQAVARCMVKRERGGVIINISSIAGSFPTFNCTAYGVSKAGIDKLTEYMAGELSPHNIRVNAIAPGTVPSGERLAGLKQVTNFEKTGILVNRWGSPEDVAQAALFLASDESGFINGQVIGVDGGASVRFRWMRWLKGR